MHRTVRLRSEQSIVGHSLKCLGSQLEGDGNVGTWKIESEPEAASIVELDLEAASEEEADELAIAIVDQALTACRIDAKPEIRRPPD